MNRKVVVLVTLNTLPFLKNKTIRKIRVFTNLLPEFVILQQILIFAFLTISLIELLQAVTDLNILTAISYTTHLRLGGDVL